ncbi:MAG: PIN domain-containing protein [Chloroflexota bacterium]
MTGILIDTNVLVYSFDLAAPQKQAAARKILVELQLYQQGCLSIQCVGEFFNVVSHGKLPKMTLLDGVEQVEFFLQSFPVFPLTPGIVRQATRAVREYQMSYYDAQIWACANLNQIPVIFSEDFQGGQVLEGVRFVNPFAEGFELEKWI